MADRPGTRQNRAFLNWLRRAAGCIDCGTKEGTLHFDHRDGTTKLFEPAHGARYSFTKLAAELLKCDVRCVACHGKKSSRARWGSPLTPEEKQARHKARWQRWYSANKEHRAAYGRSYRARREEQADGLVAG